MLLLFLLSSLSTISLRCILIICNCGLIREIFDYLCGGYRSLTVDPLPLNVVLVFEAHHMLDTSHRFVSNKAKASRFPCPFVLQYCTVLYLSKFNEVLAELLIREVVWKSPDKNLSVLGWVFMSARKLLLSNISAFYWGDQVAMAVLGLA